MKHRVLLISILMAASSAATAQAQTLPPCCTEPAGLEWSATQVARTRDPAVVQLPLAATERGPLRVGPQRWVGVWLDSLEVVRVRALSPSAKLRVVRSPSSLAPDGPRALVRVPLELGPDGHTWLRQPPGQASAFWISAETAAEIVVERPLPRVARLAWESVRRQLLDWVERGGAMPELPLSAGSTELALRWGAERALTSRIVAAYGAKEPALQELAQALRAASIEEGLDALRPWLAPYYAVRELRPSPLAGSSSEVLQVVAHDGSAEPEPESGLTWLRHAAPALSARGHTTRGGALRLEIRALFGKASTSESRPLRVRIWVGERLAFERTELARPTVSPNQAWLGAQAALQTRAGEGVGALLRATVPAHGSDHFRIEIEGGPVLVRLAEAKRRPWLREAWEHESSLTDWIERAGDALARLPESPLRAAAECLASPFLGQCSRAIESAAPGLFELARLYAVVVSPSGDTESPSIAADRALADAPGELAWWLRIRLAERAAAAGDAAAVSHWLDGDSRRPPPEIVPTMLNLLEPWPSPAGTTSARIVALDALYAREPLDPLLARRYMRVFWDRTRWRRLSPEPDPTVPEAPRPISFVVPRPLPADRPQPTALPPDGALWALAPRVPLTLDIPTASIQPGRRAILRFFVHAPAGRVVLNVDGERFQAEASGTEERWELAVRPGRHVVVLEQAPEPAQIYLRARRSDPAAANWDAEIAQSWPARDLEVVARYRLSGAGDPVRIRLRTLASGEPLGIWLFTDAGEPVRIDLGARPRDTEVLAVDSPPGLARPFELVWTPPRAARALWVEVDGEQPLYVEVAVRGENAIGAATSGPAGSRLGSGTPGMPWSGDATASGSAQTTPAVEPGQSGLWELSRRVLEPAAEADARQQRALSLLELNYGRKAQADIAWLLEHAADTSDPSLAGEGMALAEQLRQQRSEDYVRVGREFDAQSGPLALSAALFSPASNALDDPTEYGRLRSLATGQQWVQAAVLATEQYQRTHLARWGIEACSHWSLALANGQGQRFAGLAYGLAAAVEQQVAHPVVRELRVRAGRASESVAVRGTDTNAGEHRLRVWGSGFEPGPWAQAQHSLLAPPWAPGSAALVEPGRALLLDVAVNAATLLAPELWCGQLPDAEAPIKNCSVTFRVDTKTIETVRVPAGEATRLHNVELPPGPHVIEVGLSGSQDGVLVSARLGTNRLYAGVVRDAQAPLGHVVTRAREQRVYRARARAPVVATLLGPVALDVRARGFGATPAQATRVRVIDPSGTVFLETSAQLSPQLDVEAELLDLPAATVSVPTDVRVWLTGPVAYRVEIEPGEGDALIALSTRRALPDAPEQPTRVRSVAVGEILAPAWLRTNLTHDGARRSPTSNEAERPQEPSEPRGVGLVTASVDGGLQDVEERDITRTDRVWYLEPSLAYRHRVFDRRLFLMGGFAVRVTTSEHVVARPRGQALWVGLPAGLRLWLDADAALQSSRGRLEYQLRAALRVDGVYPISAHVALIPALQVRQRWLSGDRSLSALDTAALARDVDPTVFNVYAVQHRRSLTPSVNVRYQPFQDLVGSLRLRGITNENMASFDQADVRAMWSWLAQLDRWGTIQLDVRYQPSARFHDRDRQPGYVRHDVGADLAWCVWRQDRDRLCWALSDTVYQAAVVSDQNFAWLGMRYDWAHGRRLFDLTPADLAFDDLQGNREWESAPWVSR